jgi:hypothetical protein
VNRLTLIACAVLACLFVFGGVVLWAGGKEKAVAKAEAAVVVAKQEAAGAVVQAEVSADVAGAVDRLATRERIITVEVEREVDIVRLALPEDGSIEPVVAAWAAGLDRLREPAEAEGAAADAGEAGGRDSRDHRFALHAV